MTAGSQVRKWHPLNRRNGGLLPPRTPIYTRRADALFGENATFVAMLQSCWKWSWQTQLRRRCQRPMWRTVDVLSGVTWKLRHNALHKESTAAAHGRSSYAAQIRESAECDVQSGGCIVGWPRWGKKKSSIVSWKYLFIWICLTRYVFNIYMTRGEK